MFKREQKGKSIVSTMKKTVNPDLKNEREKCTFNVEEMTNFLDGTPRLTEHRRSQEDKFFKHKELFDEIPEEYYSHKEKYENVIRKGVVFMKLNKIYKDDVTNMTDFEKSRIESRNFISYAVFKDSNPFLLHLVMFTQTIMGQGTLEQQKYWAKRANKMEIIGTYAQTELGHGTFIRGLETKATYDPKTEEFVIHSPTLTSYKWWPGGMAHTANYCIVMAILYIKDKSYGIQPFMVQLRDEDTHMPLPGIKIGEIGPKLGFNSNNNGFLGFDNHRIPRDRMLMKNAQVLKDGTFVPSANTKLTYGSMIYVRVKIVNECANLLAKAATIAVRYSAVRRQSKPKPNEPEPQILDYVTQQHKLFISIATSHALSVTGWWIWALYNKVTSEITSGNLELLPELHSLACCLKAISSADSTQLIERCRLACGGQGYMQSSNLPYTYGLATPTCTFEGENTVLLLQTARSLVKMFKKGSKTSPTQAYLIDTTPKPQWENTLDGLINGFQRIAAGKLQVAVNGIETYVKSGLSYEDAWNQSSVRLVAASEAHCRAVILSVYKTEIDRATKTMSPGLSDVMQQLVQLYATYWALEKLGDLLLYTKISEKDALDLQTQYERLLAKLRPNAVALVDAFDFRDEVLQSTLGSYDGRVYERLMEEALKSPLNKEPVNDSFHKYLKPLMQGKL